MKKKMMDAVQPIYKQARRRIVNDILSQELEEGTMLPSERELSKQLGMSRDSVRHALEELQQEGIISKEERKRPVVVRLPMTGGELSNWVAFITPISVSRVVDANESQLNNIFARSIQYIEEAGWDIRIVNPLNLDDNNYRKIYRVLREKPSGILYWPIHGQPNGDIVKVLEQGECPVVMLQATVDSTRIDSVNVDQRAGIELAIRYLVEQGHRKIVHLTSNDNKRWMALRREAFVDGVKRMNVPQGEVMAIGQSDDFYSDDGWERLIKEIHERFDFSYTAVSCVSDPMAQVFYEAVRRMGKRVPDDISVVGFDNLSLDFDPPLTTVSHMSFEIGQRAAEILLEKHAGKGCDYIYKELIKPKLIVKQSVKAL